MPTSAIAQRCRFVSPAEHLWNRVQIIGNSTTFQPECRELGRELQKSYPFGWEVVWKQLKVFGWVKYEPTQSVSLCWHGRQLAYAKISTHLGDLASFFPKRVVLLKKSVFNWFLAYFETITGKSVQCMSDCIRFFLNQFPDLQLILRVFSYMIH